MLKMLGIIIIIGVLILFVATVTGYLFPLVGGIILLVALVSAIMHFLYEFFVEKSFKGLFYLLVVILLCIFFF